MSTLISLGLLLLSGCPDPTNAPAADIDPPTADGSAAEGGAADKPGEGNAGGGAHTVDATVAPGEGVVLSGTIAYEGEKTGRIRIDVLTSQGQNPYMLAKTLELPGMGEWAIELPKDFGSVNVVGFLDQTGDGPTPDDPATTLAAPVQVGTDAVEGLVLVLSDEPDLGALTPGGPPPTDGAAAEPAEGQGDPVGQPIVGGPGDPGGPEGSNPEGVPSSPDAAAGEPTPGDAAAGEPAAGDAPVGEPSEEATPPAEASDQPEGTPEQAGAQP